MSSLVNYPVLLSLLCFGIIICRGTSTQNSFQLSFPLFPHDAYARLLNTIPTPLYEFTLCHWTRIRNASEYGTIFSYATTENDNELLSITSSTGTSGVHRRTPYYQTNSTFPFNRWTHHCTTWSAYTQEFHAFRNGVEVPGFILIGQPHSTPVMSGGVVIIGQEQDAVGGAFDLNQTFNGDISEVHLWDYALCQAQISRLSQCRSGHFEGNIISWRKSSFVFNGPVVMSHVNLCEDSCNEEIPY